MCLWLKAHLRWNWRLTMVCLFPLRICWYPLPSSHFTGDCFWESRAVHAIFESIVVGRCFQAVAVWILKVVDWSWRRGAWEGHEFCCSSQSEWWAARHRSPHGPCRAWLTLGGCLSLISLLSCPSLTMILTLNDITWAMEVIPANHHFYIRQGSHSVRTDRLNIFLIITCLC